MVRRYEITESSRCKNCDKRECCEFLEKLHKAPFDSNGVILDCKSFYYTFCKLEREKELLSNSNDVDDEEISSNLSSRDTKR